MTASLRVLAFNLSVEPADRILSFGIRWMEELAKRVEYVDLITMIEGPQPAENIEVRAVGRPISPVPRKVVQAAGFYRHLHERLSARPHDVCFAHMNTIFPVLAAPLLVPRRIPIVTWYAHRATNAWTRASYRVSRTFLTSVPEAVRLNDTRKVRALGQGIETAFFTPQRGPSNGPITIVSVGRLSPIKQLDVVIRALALLRERGFDVRLELIGGVNPGTERYAEDLRSLAIALRVADEVAFLGALSAEDVRDRFRRATLHVNASPRGAIDKAALEAMSVGVPSVVVNDAFATTLGTQAPMLLTEASPDAMAATIGRVLSLSQAERERMSHELRHNVLQSHSLPALMDRIVYQLQTAARSTR